MEFWVDAHYSDSEPSAPEVVECPILDEIRAIIYNRKPDNNIIVIDDARLFMGAPPEPHDPRKWASFTQIIEALTIAGGTNIITVVDDYIVSYPLSMKENFDRYWKSTYNTRFI